MRQSSIGSMTTPARVDEKRMLAAQQRLLACAHPDPQNRHRTPVPMLPAKRAAAFHKLAARQAQAHAQLATGLGQWAMSAPFDARGVAEAASLGMAFWQQWLGLQAQWADGLAALAEEAGEVRDANTLSKAVMQEVNVLQQTINLSTVQAGLALQLFENAQNNLGYWLARRTRAAAD